MYQKVAALLRIYYFRYSFTEFTYVLKIFKGCYDTGNTHFTGLFWEATSQKNTTVLTQLEGKIFFYSKTRINNDSMQLHFYRINT